jgi:hypothetical protein
MASNDEIGRILDGRYKKGADKGAMSFLKIPLPLKAVFTKLHDFVDETIPKQILRQDAAKRKKHRKH